ncbi:ABC-2 family transporter protein [Ruminiclostridium hungatei]|uniref:ABC-2 family transporter protein n=1 Tax=Ruminiclostridium hungatei TaxID=48256 RepID=A0A1V4SLX4_RUMHU|nr:ABC transporter permease [Ruminiclostridium hungatei]OPX44485.1 ABC-2 family transporter protein [Ruminiclostridium hungatei]
MSTNVNRRRFRINPVLQKELKVKMRSWKAAILIGVYNLVLLLLTIFILKMTIANGAGVPTQSTIFGTYAFLVAAQFGLIALITPALTAGAVSGEREKQTLDILLSTTLNHGSIITGKLFASLSQVILLLISSIPVFSIIFLYGGIGFVQLIQVYLFFIVVAITLGSIGIFFSTYIKKSTAANVLTYAVVVFLGIGTLLISIFYVQMVIVPGNPNTPYEGTFWLFNLNPGLALVSLVADQFQEGAGRMFPGLNLTVQEGSLHLWHINVIFNICLSVLLLFLSAIKLNPVKRKLFKRSNG